MKHVRKVIELLPNRFYFAVLSTPLDFTIKDTIVLNVDDSEYPQLNHYFGPPNIADVWNYCTAIKGYIYNARQRVLHWSAYNRKQKFANAVFLVGCYMLVLEKNTVNQVMEFIAEIDREERIIDFADTAPNPASPKLNIRYFFEGLQKAMHNNWFNFLTFDIKAYEKIMNIYRGNMTWVLPGKFLALSDPFTFGTSERIFIDYFNGNNVKAVVRLNAPTYDKNLFVKYKILHFDLYFDDGTAPSRSIVSAFLDICDNVRGAIAVHCKAGLGRTGTLIACYMMKKYNLTAYQCAGWLRIARPGSVIGIQHEFLKKNEEWLHQETHNTCTTRIEMTTLNPFSHHVDATEL